MLYGRNPHGILDLIKEKWASGKDKTQLSKKQMIEIREHLEKVAKLARGRLMHVQGKQRERYNKNKRV